MSNTANNKNLMEEAMFRVNASNKLEIEKKMITKEEKEDTVMLRQKNTPIDALPLDYLNISLPRIEKNSSMRSCETRLTGDADKENKFDNKLRCRGSSVVRGQIEKSVSRPKLRRSQDSKIPGFHKKYFDLVFFTPPSRPSGTGTGFSSATANPPTAEKKSFQKCGAF